MNQKEPNETFLYQYAAADAAMTTMVAFKIYSKTIFWSTWKFKPVLVLCQKTIMVFCQEFAFIIMLNVDMLK